MKRGFTLIELLVVIGIIAILLGLLFPTISLVRNMARKGKATTILQQICASLEHFKDVNGHYPEHSLTGPDVFTGASSAFGIAPSYNDFAAIGDSNWDKVNLALADQLNTVDRDVFTAGKAILDPFGAGAGGKSFRYRPAAYYPFLSGSGHKAIDCDGSGATKLPNPDSYQVWCCGPDGKDDAGETGKDDIKNWKN